MEEIECRVVGVIEDGKCYVLDIPQEINGEQLKQFGDVLKKAHPTNKFIITMGGISIHEQTN